MKRTGGRWSVRKSEEEDEEQYELLNSDPVAADLWASGWDWVCFLMEDDLSSLSLEDGIVTPDSLWFLWLFYIKPVEAAVCHLSPYYYITLYYYIT